MIPQQLFTNFTNFWDSGVCVCVCVRACVHVCAFTLVCAS